MATSGAGVPVCKTAFMVGGGARNVANLLDRRFDEAFALAVAEHRFQPRDGTSVPRIGHLLAVASLVIDDGGDADQAIAGLLHDIEALGDVSVAEVGTRFGARVERIVIAVGGSCQPPMSTWREVKGEHLARLPTSPPESWRVSLADSLSEARYVLADSRRRGSPAHESEQGRELRWYHRSLVDVYADLIPGLMLDEYARVVAEIEPTAG